MKYNMVSNDTLLLCARNYAKLFGVDLRIQGTVAYTNGKAVTIPRLDLTKPNMARIAFGYLAHEAGHIRHTDFRVLKKDIIRDNTIMFNLFNIFEDARIERLMGRAYIGVRENLEFLCTYSNDDMEQYIKSIHRQPPLKLLLTYMLCLAHGHDNHYKSSREWAVKLVPYVRKYIDKPSVRRITALIRTELGLCDNSADVLKLCEKIYSIMTEQMSFPMDKKDDIQKKLANDKIESKFKEEMIGRKSASDKVKRLFLDVAELRVRQNDDVTNCTPVKTANAIVDENSAGNNTSSREDIGDVGSRVASDGYKIDVESSMPFVNRLRRHIRAYIEKMHALSERGKRIEFRKLARVPCGYNNIFKANEIELEHDTHVHLLLDLSSSMLSQDGFQTSRAQETCRAGLLLARALDNIENVERSVTAFPGKCSEYEIVLKADERLTPSVELRFGQNPRGSTPLAQAVYYALSQFKYTNKTRNIILVVTDGMPDSISNVNEAFKLCEKYGVEVVGISIRSEMIRKLFDKCHIVNNAHEINGITEEIMKRVFDSKQLSA